MTAKNKMGVKPIGRLLVNMSIPLMVSLLAQSLYNIVDGIFVARISENALTATSLVLPYSNFDGHGVGGNSDWNKL